jgi:hypothetical protein
MRGFRIPGLALTMLGSCSALIAVVALLDPVGTKLADDGDPFGVPASPLASWMLLTASVLVAALGRRFIRRSGRG